MFLRLTIAIFLLLISCSDGYYQYSIDPPLTKYVDSFYSEAKLRGVILQKDNLIIQLSYLEGSNGLTKYSINKSGKVTSQIFVWINIDYFYHGGENCVESTIFHELGHALLLRHHCDCVSYMNINDDNRCYSKYSREELLNEMFN